MRRGVSPVATGGRFAPCEARPGALPPGPLRFFEKNRVKLLSGNGFCGNPLPGIGKCSESMLRIVAEVIGRCTIQSAGTSPVFAVFDAFTPVRREIGKRTGKLFKLVRPLFVSTNGELHVEKEYIGDTIPAKCFYCHPVHSLCMDSVMPYKASENFF